MHLLTLRLMVYDLNNSSHQLPLHLINKEPVCNGGDIRGGSTLSFIVFSVVNLFKLANYQQLQDGRDVPYFNCTADIPLNTNTGRIHQQTAQNGYNNNSNPLLLGLLGTVGITSMISLFNGKNDIFSAGFGLLAFNVMVNYLRDFFRWVWQYLCNKVTYSITVKNTDECFGWLLEWFSEQKFMTDTHNMVVTTNRGSNGHYPYGNSDDDLQAPTVRYQPASGNHTIWYKGKLVTFARQKDESSDKYKLSQEILTVTIYDSSKSFLHELVQEAADLALKKQKKKITIAIFESDNWSRAVAKEKRDIDSVFLDNEMKQALESDVKFFLDNKDWYLRRGIPYRRGYLLYGPPGTGKTSSIIAIAGKFNLDISILNLNSTSMEDNQLISAISYQPRNSILVMEDVDALFVKRDSAAGASTVSFAGLLNALDGIATVDGRILFMTTNHIDRLSPALIRPGRVDRKFLYNYACKEQIKAMFKQFYETSAREDVLNALLDKLGGKKITTAQLQGWFILYCSNPDGLLQDVDNFVAQSEQDNTNTDTVESKKEPQLG